MSKILTLKITKNPPQIVKVKRSAYNTDLIFQNEHITSFQKSFSLNERPSFNPSFSAFHPNEQPIIILRIFVSNKN